MVSLQRECPHVLAGGSLSANLCCPNDRMNQCLQYQSSRPCCSQLNMQTRKRRLSLLGSFEDSFEMHSTCGHSNIWTVWVFFVACSCNCFFLHGIAWTAMSGTDAGVWQTWPFHRLHYCCSRKNVGPNMGVTFYRSSPEAIHMLKKWLDRRGHDKWEQAEFKTALEESVDELPDLIVQVRLYSSKSKQSSVGRVLMCQC